MIKHLPHLKVRAIAVEVPLFAHGFNLMRLSEMVMNAKNENQTLVYNLPKDGPAANGDTLELPPGTWSILGRASELNPRELLHSNRGEDHTDFIGHDWHDYCAEHGLTNELILIEK